MDDEILQKARSLLARHLAGRTLPLEVLGPIEEAVAEQLRDGLGGDMDDALKRLVDAYAEVAANGPVAATDDNPPTTTDVHWTSIGQR